MDDKESTESSSIQEQESAPLTERAYKARQAILTMIAAVQPTIKEFDETKRREAEQLKRETGWQIGEAPKSPNAVDGFTELPKSVQETAKKMMEEINAKRAQQGLPVLEVHGTDVGRFFKIIESGKMETSNFGAFRIGTYGQHGVPEMGFFDNSPVWVLKPATATASPLTVGELNFIIPNPKGQEKVLTGLIHKIDGRKIEGVGAAVMNIRQFGQFMNATNCKVPTEVKAK